MPATVFSCSAFGFDCRLVEVEVDILNGPASIAIVGLGDASVQESKERIRSAIKNSGAEYPRRKKTINLAPADLPKHGPMFDLPIALGLLLQSEQIPAGSLEKTVVLGELSLNGDVRRVPGVLPTVAHAAAAGFTHAIVPAENAEEAALAPNISVIAADNLRTLVEHLRGEKKIAHFEPAAKISDDDTVSLWHFEDIRGHEYAKRALMIAAAGCHNVFLYGPPGSGKTLLARSFQSILPKLHFDEAVEVTKIYSLAGKLGAGEALIKTPPFRAIHHTASMISMVGGGQVPRPGEISLAHHGVLFLDELLEFQRGALDSLRQPLEDGTVAVTRVKGSAQFPAQFMLVGASNPCPCGYFGDPVKACICKPSQRETYRKKLSGPLLDRFDLMCSVPRLPFEKITTLAGAQTSGAIQKKILQAREIQRARGYRNGRMPSSDVKRHCELGAESMRLLKEAFLRWNYSGRSYYRILKVARTIADLENARDIAPHHLAEALQYRPNFNENV